MNVYIDNGKSCSFDCIAFEVQLATHGHSCCLSHAYIHIIHGMPILCLVYIYSYWVVPVFQGFHTPSKT